MVDDSDNDFATNRYFVVSKQLQELQKSSDFSWAEVNNARIYASVIKDGSTTPTSDFYVCLDVGERVATSGDGIDANTIDVLQNGKI